MDRDSALRAPKDERPTITVAGCRCSGTTWLHRVLDENLHPVADVDENQSGYKHGLQHDADALAMIVKHPLAWLVSLKKLDRRVSWGDRMAPRMLELWAAKNTTYVGYAERFPTAVLIRYETMLDRPAETLEAVADSWGLGVPDDPVTGLGDVSHKDPVPVDGSVPGLDVDAVGRPPTVPHGAWYKEERWRDHLARDERRGLASMDEYAWIGDLLGTLGYELDLEVGDA